MREIEIKILGIDKEKTEGELVSLGARKSFEGELHAVYYDSADNSIRKNKAALRLRREGKISVLAFKTHIEDTEAKVRDEMEVEVSDFEAMRAILESAGLSPWLEMKKRRTTYELEGLHFEFDKYHDAYEYVPEFLEIEGADLGTIYKYVDLLGFRKQDCRPWDALQVAQYYSNLLKDKGL